MSQPPEQDLTPFILAWHAQQRAALARRRKQKRLAKKNKTTAQACHPKDTIRSQSQRTGDHYEARAWEALRAAGCDLLGTQLHCPFGELDLVVRDGQTLVFIEVRYRRSRCWGGAAASITRAKQERLLKTIDWWLPKLVREAFDGHMPQCRIDFATFDADNLTWHRDALRLDPDK